MHAHDGSRSSQVLLADPETLIARLDGMSNVNPTELVERYSEAQRVDLAAYCYSRSHLYELGLAIAATCEFEALTRTLGRRGEHLYEQSRRSGTEIVLKPSQRRSITLATSVGRMFPALDISED